MQPYLKSCTLAVPDHSSIFINLIPLFLFLFTLPHQSMENYSYGAASYPDSGDSSPRSREIDFENPPPWEDQSSQPPPNYKVKLMCSYGGAITPRPHDNQLSYVGGETKILSVERNIKFAPFIAKLSALCDTDVCFKYQLPGEDLDALISVTNDDDLEHMMHEYDRLLRGMAKPARLRLFLFAVNGSRNELDQRPPSTEPIRATDREIRFVEALNSAPSSVDGSSPPATMLRGNSNNVDFLFAPEKAAVLPAAVHPVIAPVACLPVLPSQPEIRRDENRVIGSDPVEIQRRIHELQRMQIGHEQQIYQQQQTQQQPYQKADVINNNGDFYKLPDQKLPPQNIQQGYWQETKQQIPASGGYAAAITTTPPPIDHQPPPQQQQQQPVYMIPAQGNIGNLGNMYRAQNPPPPAQAFYAQNQNQQPQMYRDQPPPPQQQQQMCNVVTQAAPPKMVQAYPQNMSSGMGEAGGGGGGGYSQVAYDSSGRQVYYAAQGGVMPQQTAPYHHHHHPQQGIQLSADMRAAGGLGQEGKVVITKVP